MVTVLLMPSFAKHEDAQFSMMGFKALSLQFDLRVKIPYEGGSIYHDWVQNTIKEI
jgi:hypothetical protein